MNKIITTVILSIIFITSVFAQEPGKIFGLTVNMDNAPIEVVNYAKKTYGEKAKGITEITNPLTLEFFKKYKFFRIDIFDAQQQAMISIGWRSSVVVSENGKVYPAGFENIFSQLRATNLETAEKIIELYCYLYNYTPLTSKRAEALKRRNIELKEEEYTQLRRGLFGIEVLVYLDDGNTITKVKFFMPFTGGVKIVETKHIFSFMRYR